MTVNSNSGKRWEFKKTSWSSTRFAGDETTYFSITCTTLPASPERSSDSAEGLSTHPHLSHSPCFQTFLLQASCCALSLCPLCYTFSFNDWLSYSSCCFSWLRDTVLHIVVKKEMNRRNSPLSDSCHWHTEALTQDGLKEKGTQCMTGKQSDSGKCERN